MPIINRPSRENDLALKQQLDALSPEEKASLRQQIQTEIATRKGNLGQGIMGGVRKGVSDVSDIFLQMGGLKPPADTTSDLDKLIMREQIKRLYKEEKPKTLKEQAQEAISKGEALPGYTMEETKKAAGVYIKPAIPKPKLPTGYEEVSMLPPETVDLEIARGKGIPVSATGQPLILPKPKKIQTERKLIGEIRALKSKNATIEDIEEHIRFSGYEPEDFQAELGGYTPISVKRKKFLGLF